MGFIKPTFIYPAHYLPTPAKAFYKRGICISHKEANIQMRLLESALATHRPKVLVLFVGGFCDSIMKIMYKTFETFNMQSCIKIYASFSCEQLLSQYLPILNQYLSALPICIIAHSWGASNAYRAILHINVPIRYFLTLDAVGYRVPKKRPANITLWENIFIKNKLFYPHRSNFLALIGHSWNDIIYSDYNAFLSAPCHHASINQMIEISHYKSLIRNLL